MNYLRWMIVKLALVESFTENIGRRWAALLLVGFACGANANALYVYTGNPSPFGGNVTAAVTFNDTVTPTYTGSASSSQVMNWNIKSTTVSSAAAASRTSGIEPDSSGFFPLSFDFSNGGITRWQIDHSNAATPNFYDVYTMKDSVSLHGVTEDGAIDPAGVNHFITDNSGIWQRKSFADVIAGAVQTSPSAPGITASFTPNFGLTLDEAAQIGGYDHFNWLQVATVYDKTTGTRLLDSFIDPPSGGTIFHSADDPVFFWDESVPGGIRIGWDPRYLLENQRTDTTLLFEDNPQGIWTDRVRMVFGTMLVGVRSPINYDILDLFSWSSDRTEILPVAVAAVRGRNIDPVGGEGGLLDIREHLQISDLSSEIRQLLIESGAQNIPNSVPEPETILLMLFGLLLLIDAIRRERSQVGGQLVAHGCNI